MELFWLLYLGLKTKICRTKTKSETKTKSKWKTKTKLKLKLALQDEKKNEIKINYKTKNNTTSVLWQVQSYRRHTSLGAPNGSPVRVEYRTRRVQTTHDSPDTHTTPTIRTDSLPFPRGVRALWYSSCRPACRRQNESAKIPDGLTKLVVACKQTRTDF